MKRLLGHRPPTPTLRVSVSLMLIAATVLIALHTPADAVVSGASVRAGGAPPAGSGTKQTPPYVRVVDGRTIETIIDGQQVGVTLVGIDVPQGNTACGRAATNQLRALVKGGSLTLEEDSTVTFDAMSRRVYHARTADGRSVSQELVRAGVATVNAQGEARHRFTADETQARAAKTGCLNGGTPPKTTGAVDPRAAEAGFTADGLRAIPAPPPAADAAPSAISLPTGFYQRSVVAGLTTPTGFAFAPDGRIFVAEKAGIVRIVRNGSIAGTLIDISAQVNDWWDRGLNGIAVDKNFAQNGYVYLLYTYENDAAHYDGSKTAQLARYTVSGDIALPASKQVLLGTQVGSSCTTGNDCIGSENDSHSVGSVRVASDGSLFVSIGDAASFNVVDDRALRAQNLDSLNGKVLRITTAGQGIATNPYWNGSASANRSKVWAYGLRNPFRFTLRPGTDVPYIGDVGWSTWEEQDVGAKGANLGWPCYEGQAQQDGYAAKPACQTLYGQGTGAVKFGIVTYDHTVNGQTVSAAAVGGTFYTGTAFPAAYQGAYLYGDYAEGFLRSLTVNTNDALVSGPTDFATAVDYPVDIQQGADGALYFVAIQNGELRKIVYAPGTPTAQASATPTYGATAPLNVQFSSAGSSDPQGGALTYSWNFGDGSALDTTANPAHTYTTTGTFAAVLTVTTTGSNTATAQVSITVGGTCPVGQFAASYYPNKTLSGTPVQAACTAAINYDTASTTPNWPADTVAGVDPALFSVRWSGQFSFTAGTYTFSATGDDGIRAYLDGASTPFINGWFDQGPTTYTSNQVIAAGTHTITVEYYQAAGGATAQFGWTNGPQATISSPQMNSSYKTGDVITFAGSAVDYQGNPIPPSGLKWDVIIHHCPGGVCHTHYLLQNRPGATDRFTAPDHGDDSYFEIVLTATDGANRQGTASVTIIPDTTQLTITTSPPGLQVIYSGTAYTAPVVVHPVQNSVRTIQVASPQNGQTFSGWSDGGAQQHDINTGTEDMTVTATFGTTGPLPGGKPTAPASGNPAPAPAQRPASGQGGQGGQPGPTANPLPPPR